MLIRKTILKTTAAIMAFLLFSFNYGSIMTDIRELPKAYYAESIAELERKLSANGYSSGLSVTAASTGDETLLQHSVDYKLFGFIPIKSVTAYVGKRVSLVPCGNSVGISIHTRGVLVVGIGSFTGAEGGKCSPAGDAGVKAGDVILSVSGIDVTTSEELQLIIDAHPSGVELSINRNGNLITITVLPRMARSGGCRIGAWVRDSTVGIGTLSFFDPETGIIAALGHAVIDADTGTLLEVREGDLVYADIIGVSRGQQGVPGELHGAFNSSSARIGSITGNTELGIYGYAYDSSIAGLSGEALAVAFPDEVRVGDAVIYTTIDDGGIAPYNCKIIKTGEQDEPAQKGLVIEITDQALLSKTGGIVQGMSGSPIVQDGKLVGVVTHVFVNDPHKGYGAYAYWMYSLFSN